MFLERRAVGILGFIVVVVAVLSMFFSDRPQEFDDLGLFNPAYMSAHYGKVTYPANGEFRGLVVHPPPHYWVIGQLMRLGCAPYYAEAATPFLIVLVGVCLILRSAFPAVVKLGLLLSFLVPPLTSWFSPGMRPDTHRGLSLVVGLIALESGRVAGWAKGRLMLGSALLTWASILHYPGFVAFTGVVVYMAWAVVERGWRPGIELGVMMAVAGCAVGLPYMLLFVLPHFREILAIVRTVDPIGGVAEALRVHREAYLRGFWKGSWYSPGLGESVLGQALFAPIRFGVPLIVLATPALLSKPETRAMALAALPYPLFLLLGMRHKLYWPGYYLPEFVLYVAGVAVVGLGVVQWISRRLEPKAGAIVLGGVALGAAGALVASSPSLRHARLSSVPRHHEAEIARAAGRSILGPDALVASRNAIMFYAGGGTHYFDVASDLLQGDPHDPGTYLSPFDAVIEFEAFSYVSRNIRRESLTSWYADGTLKVRGFYLSAGHPGLRYLLLSTRPAEAIVGYAMLPIERLLRYRADASGDTVFLSATCRYDAFPRDDRLLFRGSFLLPPPQAGLNPFELPLVGPGETRPKEVVTTLVPAAAYSELRSRVPAKCKVRDQIWLRGEAVDPERLVANLKKNDQIIRFYEKRDDALKARYGPEIQVTASADGRPTALRRFNP